MSSTVWGVEEGKFLGLRQVLEMGGLGGLRIIESLSMTMTGPSYTVQRTWRERLLSWPWKPWKKECTMAMQVPSKKVLVCDSMGVMIMHPETARALRDAIKQINFGEGGMRNGFLLH